MSANALVQTRIDPEIKARASAVLENMGLTVSDAVRILLTRGVLPIDFALDPAAHDAWFRAKVNEALLDTRPPLAHAEVEAHFAHRRDAVIKRDKDVGD